MPRFKESKAANGQGLLLQVDLSKQLLPGTFEHMLGEIIGTKINTSKFEEKYKNDITGASAIPPEALLKLIIYGYHKGQNSSRKIWALSRENIIARALTGDIEIHWTTIADFISGNSEAVKELFTKVLIHCGELELIEGKDFATDGLRLPSNASIENSGTIEQLKKRVEVYKKMAEKHVERHIAKDKKGETDDTSQQKYEKRQQQLQQQIEKMEGFIATHEDKTGKEGQPLQSNVTDNESALIKSSKGYIQGYVGIAIADQKNQVIMSAEAYGTANEGEHLPEMLDSLSENMEKIGKPIDEKNPPAILGDANYFSEAGLQSCEDHGVEVIIPDVQEKRRIDEEGHKKYDINDFEYDSEKDEYKCPQGKSLLSKGIVVQNEVERKKYQASLPDCKACPDFSRCSWSKKEQSELTQGRKLLVEKDKKPVDGQTQCNKMREKFELEETKAKYAKRIQIIEPVFANIRYCMGLDRFTLRGKKKVNSQWQLYCIVHNLGKCHNAYKEKRKSA